MRTKAGLLSLIFISGLGLAACASGGGAPASGASGASHDPNYIAAQELASEPAGNAYDAINHLRPQWLVARAPEPTVGGGGGGRRGSGGGGGGGSTTPTVYLGTRKLGDLTTLQSVVLSTVKEMRYFSPAAAQDRFGQEASGGAIQLTAR